MSSEDPDSDSPRLTVVNVPAGVPSIRPGGFALTAAMRPLIQPLPGINSLFSEQLLAGFRPFVMAISDQLARASLNLSRLTEKLKNCEPPNWDGIEHPDYAAALEIMNDGIPLVWVPRAAVVGRLMRAADYESRAQILAQERLDIADDCSRVLDQVGAPDLEHLMGLAAEAVRALRDGYCAPAQSLAKDVVDTWLRDAARRGVVFDPVSDYGFYRLIGGQLEPVTGGTRFTELKAAGVLAPVAPALARFNHGDPVLPRFSRHASAHDARPEHYTNANAVVAVMLMTSALRQSDELGW